MESVYGRKISKLNSLEDLLEVDNEIVRNLGQVIKISDNDPKSFSDVI